MSHLLSIDVKCTSKCSCILISKRTVVKSCSVRASWRSGLCKVSNTTLINSWTIGKCNICECNRRNVIYIENTTKLSITILKHNIWHSEWSFICQNYTAIDCCITHISWIRVSKSCWIERVGCSLITYIAVLECIGSACNWYGTFYVKSTT